jgi:hypothetical protein
MAKNITIAQATKALQWLHAVSEGKTNDAKQALVVRGLIQGLESYNCSAAAVMEEAGLRLGTRD